MRLAVLVVFPGEPEVLLVVVGWGLGFPASCKAIGGVQVASVFVASVIVGLGIDRK